MRKQLALSLLIHLGLLGLALWAAHHALGPKPAPAPLLVEIAMPRARPAGPTHGDHAGPRADLRRPRGHSRTHLKLGLVAHGESESSRGGEFPGGDGMRGSSDGYAVADAMGIAQESRLYPFFEALWQRVDAATTYPEDFVQQRIHGRVTAQLGVDRRGVFTGEIRSIRGADPLLNAFVMATLAHALGRPLRPESWMPSAAAARPMLIVFQFDFETFGPGGAPVREPVRHFKNVLAFRRDAYVDPKLTQEIEKIFTHYVPPIIPIPGGFIIDFVHAYEFYENLGKPDPDDMRRLRIEQNRDQWERVVEKAGPTF